MDDLQAIALFVATAVWRVWPAFLLSILLGVLIRSLKLDGLIRSALSARVGTAIVLATVVGAFSPFCSCTVIPVVSGLLLSGVPLAPVMAFWIASPTMDPEIFALSVATLGWPLALARLGATLLLSLGAGFLTLALMRSGLLGGQLLRRQKPAETCCATSAAAAPARAVMTLTPAGALMPLEIAGGRVGVAVAAAPACGVGGCGGAAAVPARAERWWHTLTTGLRALDARQVGREVAAQSWNLGRWLLLAFVLEALITLYVPQAAIAGLLGTESRLAIPLAALVGVPLYLSNISALPIVAGLLGQGMQPGAAIAFLIAGPVTTVPAMTAVWGVVGRRVFALYLGIGLLGAMLLGLVAQLIVG